MEKRQISYMLNWSKPYATKYKFYLILLFFLILVSAGLNLIQVNFVQRSIDAVLARDWRLLSRFFIFFVSIAGLRILHSYYYGFYSNYVDVHMTRDAKNKYIKAILNAQMFHITKQSSGDLINKHNNDIPAALNFIRELYSNLLLNPIMAISGFTYLLFFNWKLSVLVFIPIPLLSILLNFMSNRSSRFYKRIMELKGNYTEEIYDVAHGIETIKAYNIQSYKLNKVRSMLKDIFKEELKYSKNDAITIGMILAVSYLPNIIALIYGGMLVMRGEISVSVLFAYNQLIPVINTPTINLFSSFRSIKNSYQSMKRLDSLFDIEHERIDGQTFSKIGSESIVKFEHVQFSYDKKNPVLHDLSLELTEGKSIGIIGDSGAGKSTIVNLICGFYQVENGSISFFGKDISAWNLEGLRSNIAYVSQDIHILPGTIFENIQYSRLTSSEEEVYDAVQKAGLSDFIINLPSGYNTVLKENGDNLSGGQRQRISLARAFLKNAPIYIFDEPTASLDPATEKLVIKSIQEIRKDKSIIIISHNLEPLKICDEIYLIKDGKVTDKGTFETILVNRESYNNQYKNHLEGAK